MEGAGSDGSQACDLRETVLDRWLRMVHWFGTYIHITA